MTVAPLSVPVPATAARRAALLDRTVLLMALASTCIIVGLVWDISWHRTIGRDTFWTPAHLMIYLGGLISGSACAVLVFATTFGRDAGLREHAVGFWGFRAPIGAWVAIWGAIAMLTSAPFDDWWHNAYGLDVKVLSPPHALLGVGMASIQLGALLLATSRQHAVGALRGRRRLVSVWVAALWLAMFMEMILEYRFANNQHAPIFYAAVAMTAPIPLAAAARGLGGRWPATQVAACYLLISLLMLWILPRFGATPLLGPITNPVTHMVAPPFPLLLVVPALACDLLLAGRGGRALWWRIPLAAAAMVALLALVQWPFATFLVQAPGARGWFFGADQWNYNSNPGSWQYEFWNLPDGTDGRFLPAIMGPALLAATGWALLTTAIGAGLGHWLARVRR